MTKTPKKLPKGTFALAKLIGDIATGQVSDTDPGKDPAAVALGRKGGLKGGNARAASLTAKQRSAIAKKAARARWPVKAKP
jgi:hypothetical protein